MNLPKWYETYCHQVLSLMTTHSKGLIASFPEWMDGFLTALELIGEIDYLQRGVLSRAAFSVWNEVAA